MPRKIVQVEGAFSKSSGCGPLFSVKRNLAVIYAEELFYRTHLHHSNKYTISSFMSNVELHVKFHIFS